MIIVRSPLRITLGGGGTDLPSYYREHGGYVLAAAIDQYVYVSLAPSFDHGIRVRHSEIEHAATIGELRHPIIREALQLLEVDPLQIEITTLADIPSGTGLGSSGSFTTALLLALHTYRRTEVSPERLADLACHVEMDLLGEPIGKQDQYIAAFGGLTCFAIDKAGSVAVERLALDATIRSALEEQILLFFTGYSRSASDILRAQVSRLESKDQHLFNALHFEKENGLQSKEALQRGDLQTYGQLLHEHWDRKRHRSPGISSAEIDRWYQIGLRNGALGGKLLGAGGGGFLMFVTEDPAKLRSAMHNEGLVEVHFRFVRHGTQVLVE